MILHSKLDYRTISGYCCSNKFNVLGKYPVSGTKWREMALVHTGFTLLNWMAASKVLVRNRPRTNGLLNNAEEDSFGRVLSGLSQEGSHSLDMHTYDMYVYIWYI